MVTTLVTKGGRMAGKVRHLINRSGRYHARLVVPKDIRGVVGKTELRAPLGGDYRQALRLLPGAVAQLQHQIAQAEHAANAGRTNAAPARYPLAPDQLALSHYNQRLAYDDVLRNDPRYASSGYVDDLLVGQLRDATAGRADDAELQSLVGAQIERFRNAGNLDAEAGTTEWREIARALCHAELEALERVVERDEGDFSGALRTPMLKAAQAPEKRPEPVSLKRLWADYVAMRRQTGTMRDGGKRQSVAAKSLRTFVRHDDATRLTKRDVLAWRDELLKTLSGTTVSSIYLSTIRSLLNWAVENDRLPENVAATVKQAKARKARGREKGYTDEEAVKVVKASRSYRPKVDEWGRIREAPELTAAKQWVPIICAFTGARVSEITQLRKEDIRKIDGNLVMRITPEAGTVKTGEYRDVPLHRQIVDEGFADFVAARSDGPLFHNGTDPDGYEAKAKRYSNRLASWLSSSGLTPEGLQPNHAWRHRLKTQCRELGISDRVVDAIQGHAGKTAGDNYGDVTLKTKIDVVNKLPAYSLHEG